MKKALALLAVAYGYSAINAERNEQKSIGTWDVDQKFPDMALDAGDRLTFNYNADNHDVALVEGSNDPCSLKNDTTTEMLDDTGSFTWTVPLVEGGGHWWLICTIDDHCERGMKVKVTMNECDHVIDWSSDGIITGGGGMGGDTNDTTSLDLNVGDKLCFNFTGSVNVQQFRDSTAAQDCDFSSAKPICNGEGPCTVKIDNSMKPECHFGANQATCNQGLKIGATVEGDGSSASTVAVSLASAFLGFAALFSAKRF
jgi:hypothetical protein